MNVRETLLMVALVYYVIIFFGLFNEEASKTVTFQNYTFTYKQVFTLLAFLIELYFFFTSRSKRKAPQRTRVVKREFLPEEQSQED